MWHFSNHTFLHYSVLVWRNYLRVERRKEWEKKMSNIHLFLLWKIPDHYYKKVDADKIWIYRLLITYKLLITESQNYLLNIRTLFQKEFGVYNKISKPFLWCSCTMKENKEASCKGQCCPRGWTKPCILVDQGRHSCSPERKEHSNGVYRRQSLFVCLFVCLSEYSCFTLLC